MHDARRFVPGACCRSNPTALYRAHKLLGCAALDSLTIDCMHGGTALAHFVLFCSWDGRLFLPIRELCSAGTMSVAMTWILGTAMASGHTTFSVAGRTRSLRAQGAACPWLLCLPPLCRACLAVMHPSLPALRPAARPRTGRGRLSTREPLLW